MSNGPFPQPPLNAQGLIWRDADCNTDWDAYVSEGEQQAADIAEILWEHRWYANRDNPPFGRCACDWPPTKARLEINAHEHPTHVAKALMGAGLRLADAT